MDPLGPSNPGTPSGGMVGQAAAPSASVAAIVVRLDPPLIRVAGGESRGWRPRRPSHILDVEQRACVRRLIIDPDLIRIGAADRIPSERRRRAGIGAARTLQNRRV